MSDLEVAKSNSIGEYMLKFPNGESALLDREMTQAIEAKGGIKECSRGRDFIWYKVIDHEAILSAKNSREKRWR